MAEEELKPTIVPLSGKLVTSKDSMTLQLGDFQTLTNMRYKRRNPVSILGMTKYNTATVVDGTASPGTYMKTRQGFHFKKDTPTDLGRDSSGDNGDEDPSELFPELIGWWKLDEGSGTTAYNSADPTDPADKLPDLPVGGNSSYFWSGLSGFGTCGLTTNKAYLVYWSDTAIYTSTNNDDFGFFIRLMGKNGTDTYTYPFLLGEAVQHANDITGCSMEVYGVGQRIDCEAWIGKTLAGQFSGTPPSISYDTDINRWMFIFSQYEDGLWKIRCVRDDGTMVTGATSIAGGTWSLNAKTIRAFIGYSAATGSFQYIYGSMGDIMYFTTLRLTISQWAQVYDSLRSRYSMAARSGWG